MKRKDLLKLGIIMVMTHPWEHNRSVCRFIYGREIPPDMKEKIISLSTRYNEFKDGLIYMPDHPKVSG